MNDNNNDISGCITFSDKKFFQDLDAEEAMSITGGRFSLLFRAIKWIIKGEAISELVQLKSDQGKDNK